MTTESMHIRGLLESVLDMFSQTRVPALVTDSKGLISIANKPFLSLTGYTENELLGSSFKSMDKIEDEIEIKRRKRYLRASSGHYQGYVILKGATGREFFCRMIIDKLSAAGFEYYVKQFFVLSKRRINDYKDLVVLRNLIENGIEQIKGISDLCQMANLEYRRVLLLIREFEGTTPKQYLNDSRIWCCKEMLESGDKTYKEIAYELGFCDVSHLCNSFKEKTKMTLSEYVEANC